MKYLILLLVLISPNLSAEDTLKRVFIDDSKLELYKVCTDGYLFLVATDPTNRAVTITQVMEQTRTIKSKQPKKCKKK